MQAVGEGGEEERGPQQQPGERGETGERMAGQDGSGGKAGREPDQEMIGPVEEVKQPAVGHIVGAGVRRHAVEVEELDADDEQRHQAAEDLAGAAGGEPAFHPNGEGARDEDVECGIDGEDDGGGGRERWSGDADADGRGEQREAADDGAGGQQAQRQAENEVAAEAQGKTQQRGGVEGGHLRGDADAVDGDELPQQGNAGEQRRQVIGVASADGRVGDEARAERRGRDP